MDARVGTPARFEIEAIWLPTVALTRNTCTRHRRVPLFCFDYNCATRWQPPLSSSACQVHYTTLNAIGSQKCVCVVMVGEANQLLHDDRISERRLSLVDPSQHTKNVTDGGWN